MSPDLKSLMKIEVPLVVVLGERGLKINDIRNWVPGSIIELARSADEDLEIRVNNKSVGTGIAVKIGENFGVEINYIGAPEERINALGPAAREENQEDIDAEAMAAALLDGQL